MTSRSRSAVARASASAAAADRIFVVDTTADTVDASPGDGICPDAADDCSLLLAF